MTGLHSLNWTYGRIPAMQPEAGSIAGLWDWSQCSPKSGTNNQLTGLIPGSALESWIGSHVVKSLLLTISWLAVATLGPNQFSRQTAFYLSVQGDPGNMIAHPAMNVWHGSGVIVGNGEQIPSGH